MTGNLTWGTLRCVAFALKALRFLFKLYLAVNTKYRAVLKCRVTSDLSEVWIEGFGSLIWMTYIHVSATELRAFYTGGNQSSQITGDNSYKGHPNTVPTLWQWTLQTQAKPFFLTMDNTVSKAMVKLTGFQKCKLRCFVWKQIVMFWDFYLFSLSSLKREISRKATYPMKHHHNLISQSDAQNLTHTNRVKNSLLGNPRCVAGVNIWSCIYWTVLAPNATPGTKRNPERAANDWG